MTASELKYEVETRGTCEHFFTRSTMKFFGDRMSNYGVRSANVETWTEGKVEVWELYRKNSVKHGLTDSVYFRKDSFERIYVKK